MSGEEPNVYDARPIAPSGAAVLLLAGSSGRIERERADLLAGRGTRVRAIRWFGGPGLRPAPHEVPIELFIEQLDLLRQDGDRVAVLGTSFGAEAALVTAAHTELDAVIAVAPSSVVWAGVHGGAWSSHWTFGGRPLPYVAFDPDWAPDGDPPAYVGLYERSLDRDPLRSRAAQIAVERIAGDVVLVAGGDDRVWPSIRFARAIVGRRAQAGLPTTLVTEPDAGHRMILPGEEPAPGGVRMFRGGTPAADAALGARVWPEILRVLRSR